MGNLTFIWMAGWGGENWIESERCQMTFSFSAPKLLTAVNTCLEEMEEFKGRGRATS